MARGGDNPAHRGKGLCQDWNEEGQPQTPSMSCQCPERFVRLSQCHEQPPRWERGVLGAARCRTANSVTCPQGFCESTLNPSAVAGAQAELLSPRQGHGQHCPHGAAAKQRAGGEGSQLPLERDQERFRLLPQLKAFPFLSPLALATRSGLATLRGAASTMGLRGGVGGGTEIKGEK